MQKYGYNLKYRAEHLNSKGRVADWLKAQSTVDDYISLNCILTVPYMDMLKLVSAIMTRIRTGLTRAQISPSSAS